MIRYTDKGVFLKDIKTPTELKIKVRAGISDSSLSNKKVALIDVSPLDYIKGGSKSTGSIFSDLVSYLSDVYDNVIKNVYFDLSIKEEVEIARRLLKNHSTGSISDKYIANLIKPIKETIINKDAVEFLDTTDIFRVIIDDVITDVEFSNTFEPTALFTILFKSSYYRNDSIIYNSATSKYALNLNNRDFNYKFESFLNILTRVFFYYYSDVTRMQCTATVAETICLYKREAGNIKIWNKYLEQYIPFHRFTSNSLSSSGGQYVAYNLNAYNMTPNELCDFNSKSIISDVSEETLIGTQNIVPNTFDYYNHFVTGYSGYLNTKNNSGEAVALQLGFKHINKDKNKIIHYTMFESMPFSSILNEFSDLAILDTIDYYDYEAFDNCHSLTCNPRISAEVSIAYITRAGGKTFTDYDSLKDKKIPKQRRDLIFKILCDICYEHDIEPVKIIDKLDVDFKRHYKTATQFE